MKKSLLAIVIALFMAVPAFSVGPPGSGGVSSGIQTAADCNVAAYYAIGTLCQQTGDGKLFKGTGAAVEEITAGVGIAADGSVPFTGKETFGAGLATKNGTTSPGFIDFYEDGDEAGSHYFRLYGPEALADSIFIKLPAMAGNTGGMLYFSAANTLSIAGAGAQGKIWQMGAAVPAWSTGVLTEGANTFNYTLGTASLDVAAGAALNIDTSLQTTTGAIILVGQAGGSSVTVPASGTLATTTYVPTTITVADTADTTTFVCLFEDATGDKGPKTDAGITYNASSGMLTVTGLTTGAGGITTASSDSPTDTFLDTQAPGADKEIAKIVGGYVDGADGAENGTLDLYAHEAGTSTSYVTVDGKNTKVKINKKLETAGVIELGHASDTTLARQAAGAVTVEDKAVVLIGGTLVTRTEFIPVGWMIDGATAPAAIATTDLGTRQVKTRAFQGATADQDLEMFWQAPNDIVDGDAAAGFQVKWRPIFVITSATTPAASEGVAFALQSCSSGNGDTGDCTVGTASVIADADLDAHVQFDVVYGGWTEMTVTDGAVSEAWFMKLYRDQDNAIDDYAEPIGLIGIELKYQTKPLNDY